MALAKVGASRTAVFSNLVPLVGILLAWLFLGERLAPIQLLGGLLAVAGVVACQRSGARGPGRLGSHAREQRPGGA